MADSASESDIQSDKLGLRRISSSLFHLPGFFTGFNANGSSYSDSLWSPTSPLDFSFFSNLTNPFSFKPAKSPPENVREKKLDCCNVGLGIIKLLADETYPTNEVLHSPKGKHIIFGPQVKASNPVRSTSLPRDYMSSLVSQSKTPRLSLCKSDDEVLLEPKPFENSSAFSLNSQTNLSSRIFCSQNRTNVMATPPLIISESSQIENSIDIKAISLPTPYHHAHIGSLTAREIELSEDYTCIISHGPNPKTTHVFGDCILECHTTELSSFDKTVNVESELPQEANFFSEGAPPYPSNLCICYHCKKKLEKSDDINVYGGEKAFCSFDCRSEAILAEEGTEEAYNDSGSCESSYDEQLFFIEFNHPKWSWS
ncbi:hypothetical protein K2173_024714 [Erythroxylum novogranatense]|uniref:FLZ-type domain-containing protein n=1 Tax=Erythroxylum novogranatense TaxID=1862640 RepID=A0AAV8SV78_9ROSI|nr:hypothetical protein K2173_024714 [Erythroxylum novogranatense]